MTSPPPKTLLDVMDHHGWEHSPTEGGPGWVWRRTARGWLTTARAVHVTQRGRPPRSVYEYRIEFGHLPFLPHDCFLCVDVGEVADLLRQRNLILED